MSQLIVYAWIATVVFAIGIAHRRGIPALKAEEVQRREIARLREQSLKLKEEIERESGRPIRLTTEERIRMATLSQGMDPETPKEIPCSVLSNSQPQ